MNAKLLHGSRARGSGAGGDLPPKKRARAGDMGGQQPRETVAGCAMRVGPTERARLLAN